MPLAAGEVGHGGGVFLRVSCVADGSSTRRDGFLFLATGAAAAALAVFCVHAFHLTAQPGTGRLAGHKYQEKYDLTHASGPGTNRTSSQGDILMTKRKQKPQHLIGYSSQGR